MKTKTYSSGFETKVAMEAIRDERSLTELSRKYDVCESQILAWKTHLLMSVNSALGDIVPVNMDNRQVELCHRIGELRKENALLRRVLGH